MIDFNALAKAPEAIRTMRATGIMTKASAKKARKLVIIMINDVISDLQERGSFDDVIIGLNKVYRDVLLEITIAK